MDFRGDWIGYLIQEFLEFFPFKLNSRLSYFGVLEFSR